MTKIIEIQSGDNTQTQLQEIKPQSFNTIKIIKSMSATPNPVFPSFPFLLIFIISFHLLYIYYNKFFIKNQVIFHTIFFFSFVMYILYQNFLKKSIKLRKTQFEYLIYINSMNWNNF